MLEGHHILQFYNEVLTFTYRVVFITLPTVSCLSKKSSWSSGYLYTPASTSVATRSRPSMLSMVSAVSRLASIAIRFGRNHCGVLDPKKVL